MDAGESGRLWPLVDIESPNQKDNYGQKQSTDGLVIADTPRYHADVVVIDAGAARIGASAGSRTTAMARLHCRKDAYETPIGPGGGGLMFCASGDRTTKIEIDCFEDPANERECKLRYRSAWL